MQSNKKSFKGQKIFVGIDVHAKNWAVETLGVSTYRSLSDSTVVAEVGTNAFLCWSDFCIFIRKNSEIIVLS